MPRDASDLPDRALSRRGRDSKPDYREPALPVIPPLSDSRTPVESVLMPIASARILPAGRNIYGGTPGDGGPGGNGPAK